MRRWVLNSGATDIEGRVLEDAPTSEPMEGVMHA